jgi:hypothetical protein
MPVYEFVTDAGERAELVFSMSQAPAVGETIERDGRRWRRVPSTGVGGAVPFKPFTSTTLPEDCPEAPRHNADGQAVFETRRELNETLARINDRAARNGGATFEALR